MRSKGSKEKKEKFELEVFHEFALASALPIRPETVSHGDGNRDEPDVVCETIDEGVVGLELTELIDERFKRRSNFGRETERALIDYWQTTLSPAKSDEFKRKYGNAILRFQFGPKVHRRSLRSALGSIFEALLTLPEGFNDFALKYDPKFLRVLQYVIILRGNSVGPGINVSDFGWLGDPTGTQIAKKLNLSKRYRCDYPIELLAYVNRDLLPPEGVWKAAADEAANRLNQSQLRRIWIFDRTQNRVLYVNPEPSR